MFAPLPKLFSQKFPGIGRFKKSNDRDKHYMNSEVHLLDAVNCDPLTAKVLRVGSCFHVDSHVRTIASLGIRSVLAPVRSSKCLQTTSLSQACYSPVSKIGALI